MEGEVDLINRDPNNMNNFLHVEFADVLAEPQSAHSVDCVWANSGACFKGGKDCCYKFLSFFCGLCICKFQIENLVTEPTDSTYLSTDCLLINPLLLKRWDGVAYSHMLPMLTFGSLHQD